MKAAEINTIGATRKIMEGLTENMFPVAGDLSYESYNEIDEDYDAEEES